MNEEGKKDFEIPGNLKDQVRGEIKNILTNFGEQEAGNKLSVFALNGLMFALSEMINRVIPNKEGE